VKGNLPLSKAKLTLAQREQVTLFTKELAAVLRRIAGHPSCAPAGVESFTNSVEPLSIKRTTARTRRRTVGKDDRDESASR
jgi:hypothetical protein